ncbi:MAG: Xanthine/uracil/thiamine/ascorbate permease family protein, partial [Thermoleophilia bacterium]|nr:Xanthine/uracil/thiamine/ascorbate permease family protein [Thermoleophilia bacterium]
GDGGQYGTTSTSSSDKPVSLRQVTAPKADADLTEEMGDDGAALVTAGCSFGTYKEEEANHVKSVDDLDFATFPPTSGTHFEVWATPGVYDKQVADGFAVHDLEHGEVVLSIGTKVDDAQAKLLRALPKDEEKWVVTPRPDLAGVFAAAWAKGLSCPPEALAKLTDEQLEAGIRTWYAAVVSTGSEAEKDIPAYAGAMKEPTPARDISVAAPF